MPILRVFHKLLPLLAGLGLSQILASWLVYRSNMALYQRVSAIREAGFLAIPNALAAPDLKTVGAAFIGGLFFSLTVGAGLSLLSMTGAWLYRTAGRPRLFFFPAVGFLLYWMVLINLRNICPLMTAFFILIPPIVFWLCLKNSPSGQTRRHLLFHVVTFILLLILGAGNLNRGLFVTIRDKLLLSNPVGLAFNDLYYQYTLYAAEAFKSPSQKLQRVFHYPSDKDAPLDRRIKARLVPYNYFPAPLDVSPDLVIQRNGKQLALATKNQKIVTVSSQEFLQKTGTYLKRFSEKSDQYVYFRQFTFYCLLLVSALSLYGLLYLPGWIVCRIFLGPPMSGQVACGVALCIGGAFLLLPGSQPLENAQPKALFSALKSEDPEIRIHALKAIHKKGLELGDFPGLTALAKSPHLLERYWLAQALGRSRSPATYKTLLTLLDDGQFNVAYKAYASLAQRKQSRAIPEILGRIREIRLWYVQWYAYRSLKKLGWRQRPSR